MKYKVDHDYHIHSHLSLCSNDSEQTAENILKYAEKNNLSEICLTDHFWDENVPMIEYPEGGWASPWYAEQNFAHISQNCPLPQGRNVKFYFGCETDIDKHMRVGVSDELFDQFDLVIISTTHLHMNGFTIEAAEDTVEERANVYKEKLNALLDKNLPFEKICIAHLTCPLLIGGDWKNRWDEHLQVIDLISNDEFSEIFSRVAQKGAGIELNFSPFQYTADELPRVLRPYQIAKAVGCKFCLGSDAHHPGDFDDAIIKADALINLLDLEEKDKFRLHKVVSSAL